MQSLVDILSDHTRLGLGVVVAGLVTLAAIVVLRKVAHRVNLLDNPGQHRGHGRPTPLVGGIAIFVGVVVGMICLNVSLSGLIALFAGSSILVVVGILDDMNKLPTAVRLAAQIFAGLLMALWGGVTLDSLGYILFSYSELTLGMFAVPATVFACVCVISAINMSDGTDGQGGVLVMVPLLGLLLSVFISGRMDVLPVVSVVAVCVLVFLGYNLRTPWRFQASVFMGDCGSMLLGFVLCWLLITFSQGNAAIGFEPAIRPVTALWLLALPLLDTFTVMLRRVLEGGSPFRPDRTHYHHLLRAADLGIKETVVVIAVTAINFGGFGLVGEAYGVSEVVMFYTFMFVFAIWFCGSYFAIASLRETQSDYIMMRDRRASARDQIPGGVDRRQGERRTEDQKPEVAPEEVADDGAVPAQKTPVPSEA